MSLSNVASSTAIHDAPHFPVQATPANRPAVAEPGAEAALERLYADGVAGLPGAFGLERGAELREDFHSMLNHALSYEGGTVNRGPHRYYFSVPAERVRGFEYLVSHPLLAALSAQVCGPDWQMVEVAFDVPRAGAVNQPWHRDFATPPDTEGQKVLTSLAFNVSTVDVTSEMGPFEVAPGTHWDDGRDWPYGMFPIKPDRPRYEALAQKRLARLGDISVRTGLTIHRGTANTTDVDRGVLILGVVNSDDPTPDTHRLTMTRRYYEALPAAVRRHLRVTLVDELPAQQMQTHDIEGLVMGAVPGE